MYPGIATLSLLTLVSFTLCSLSYGDEKEPEIIEVAKAPSPDPSILPTLRVVKEKLWGEYYPMLSARFPNLPDFQCDAWCYESAVDFVSAEPLPDGGIQMTHRDQKNPHVLIVTTVTPRPESVEFVARVQLENPSEMPSAPPFLNVCWQFRHAPGFASTPDPYPAFVKRCFVFTHRGLTFLGDTDRAKIPVQPPDHEYNNPPWVQTYSSVAIPISATSPTSWAGTSPDRFLVPVIGVTSRDGKYLAAIANDSADTMAQAWHDCLHNNPKWAPTDALVEKQSWCSVLYVMENEPSRLLKRIEEDFPRLRQIGHLASPPTVKPGWQTVATRECWLELPEGVTWLKSLPLGPFVRLDDGSLLCVSNGQVFVSSDEGISWENRPLLVTGIDTPLRVGAESALIRTVSGTLVLVFMNMATYSWSWDAEKRLPGPDVKLPVWAMRSVDNGKTWTDAQIIYDGYCGDIHDILQTQNGVIIAPVQELLYEDGRHALRPRYSVDDGKTWQRANLLDIGGRGHHDGLIEGTLVEQMDGQIWLLCRTNLGRFWSAFSDNEGKSFRILLPSDIPASSAPATMKRLSSGRLILVWNRPMPDGASEPPEEVMAGGDGQWSETRVSNYRAELSVAFSEDDGKTWTTPRVVARRAGTNKGYLAYAYVFEPRAGEIWITTMQGDVRISLQEEDWLK